MKTSWEPSMKKRGQMEILGFMVIVLLFFFALIMYFKFAAKGGSDVLAEAEQNLEVSNVLNGVRLYTICEDTSLGDAIKACVEDGFICSESACDVVKREVPAIISAYGWDNDSYMFYVGEELYSSSTCKGNTFVDDYTTSGESIRLVYCY